MQIFRDTFGRVYPINRIASIMPSHKVKGSDDFRLPRVLTVDDESIEINQSEYANLMTKMSRVVPANPGFRLLTYYFDEEGDDWFDECEIIAWREDDHGEFDPVVSDEGINNLDGIQMGILEPTGRVRVPYVTEYESRSDWEEEMRKNAQERRNGKKSSSGDAAKT